MRLKYIFLIMICVFLGNVSMAQIVLDMPIGWSKYAVRDAIDNNILKVENGYIRPLDMLTREEMAYGIVNVLGANKEADLSDFIDVSLESPYYEYIAKAVEIGIISGYGNGMLKPQKTITREEMFVVLYNALKFEAGNVEVLDRFNDKDLISDWAKSSTARMVENGYISGNTKGNIKPKENITREEFAQVMKNIFNSYYFETEKQEIPTLAFRDTWYKGSKAKDTITKIIIVDKYILTGRETESWFADEKNAGEITCYIRDNEVVIVGNGTGKIYANPDSVGMFEHFNALSTVEGNILDTSKVADMSNMFNYCMSLTNLDISTLDTSKVTDMSNMFNHCTALAELNLSHFNTTSVVNMKNMFNGCWNLEKLDISGFNTNNVSDMTDMFKDCSKLKEVNVGVGFKINGDGSTNCGISKKLLK